MMIHVVKNKYCSVPDLKRKYLFMHLNVIPSFVRLLMAWGFVSPILNLIFRLYRRVADFSHTSRPVLGPTQPPVQWCRVFPGDRAAGAW
jgi:hypothetical protein